MLSRSRRAAAGWAAVLAISAAGAVATAGAQTAKPAPGCAGMSLLDPKGDAKRTTPTASGSAAAANLDITGIYFTHEGGKTFAHMQLADANDTMPRDDQGLRWYINYTAKGAARWVRASRNVPDDTLFEFGHYEDTVRVLDGETPGSFVTGPDGVLRLQVPSGAGGAAGGVISKVFADTAEVLPNVVVGPPPARQNKLYVTDRAPDAENAFGKDFAVGSCPSTTPGPDTGGGAGGGSGVVPAPGGGGDTGGGPTPPQNQPVEPAALPVKVAGKGGSARKVSKKKKLALAIQASQPVKDVVAKLYTGDPAKPKVIAQAKLAQLSGKGKLTFKLAKKLKKGTVALRVDGTLADGRKGIANFKVKFGK